MGRLSDSSLDSHLSPGSGGMFVSLKTFPRQNILFVPPMDWVGCSPNTCPHQNIPFFPLSKSHGWQILKRFGGPKPPPVKLPVSTANCTVSLGLSKYYIVYCCHEDNVYKNENNQFNPLQEILCLKSTTLLSMKMKKRRRHISICTGFRTSTRRIFWTGHPYSCSKRDSLFSHFLGFPTLGRAFLALQSLCLWEGNNVPINWIDYKV